MSAKINVAARKCLRKFFRLERLLVTAPAISLAGRTTSRYRCRPCERMHAAVRSARGTRARYSKDERGREAPCDD